MVYSPERKGTAFIQTSSITVGPGGDVGTTPRGNTGGWVKETAAWLLAGRLAAWLS